MSLTELQNEHTEVKLSLKKIQNEIDKLESQKRKLEENCSAIEAQIELQQSSKFANVCVEEKWYNEEFSWKDEVHKKLQDTFKIPKLRDKQLEAINATMSGKDVFLVMPTGGGKSLCYQLPALLSAGVTLVISPLVSLMEDQCLNIRILGIKSSFLCADTVKEESSKILKSLGDSKLERQLLYVTPERIAKSKRFMAQLEKCYKHKKLSRIAIDEAHCASQWGNDFRPDYKVLGILKRQYPDTPMIALTATATSKVIADTKKMLNIPQALVFKSPLNRPNLFYEVRHKVKDHNIVMTDIANTIKSNFKKRSGIIYCFSRADCEKVSSSLNQQGVSCAAYHANMVFQAKSRVHAAWRTNQIQVICATVAFGMGIDKSDVGFVIHHSVSKSLENYYQESGRAGRDGSPSLCLLYFGFQDIFRQSTMVLTEQTGLVNLYSIVQYCCRGNKCRRQVLSSHFGENPVPMKCNESCDVCSEMLGSQECDVTQACRSLLGIVCDAELKGEKSRLTAFKLLEIACGRGAEKTRDAVLLSTPQHHLQLIIIHMLLEGYLREDFHFTPYSTISYVAPGSSNAFLEDSRVHLHLPSEKSSRKSYDHLFSNMIGQSTSMDCDVECVSAFSDNRRRNKRRRVESFKDPILIEDSE